MKLKSDRSKFRWRRFTAHQLCYIRVNTYLVCFRELQSTPKLPIKILIRPVVTVVSCYVSIHFLSLRICETTSFLLSYVQYNINSSAYVLWSSRVCLEYNKKIPSFTYENPIRAPSPHLVSTLEKWRAIFISYCWTCTYMHPNCNSQSRYDHLLFHFLQTKKAW
jgi:hypothetical protein